MIWQRRRHWSRIGIDVGPRSIGAAQLYLTSRGWRLRCLGRFARTNPGMPPEPAEVERLRGALERLGFQGREVAVCVPESHLLTASLELPPRSSGAPLEQLARVELARTHRRDAAGLELCCWEVPAPARAAQTTHMIAAACAHAEADSLLDAFEEGGLYVGALDARVWAMARASGRALADTAALTAVLDVGEEAAVLAVIGDGNVVFERSVAEAGVSKLRASLRERFGIEGEVTDFVLGRVGATGTVPEDMSQWDSLDQAAESISDHAELIASEMGASLSYVRHRYEGLEIGRLLLTGDGAAWPGLTDKLAAALSIRVEALRPRDAVDGAGDEPTASDPGLSVAVGLAMNEG